MLTGLTNNINTQDDSETIRNIAFNWLEYWDRMNTEQNFNYVNSHAPILDDKICGFQPGEYVMLAARPGIGKTAMAIQIFWENMKRGITPGMISLEATKKQIVQRIIAGDTGFAVNEIKMLPEQGYTRNTRIEIITKKVSEIGNYQAVINSESNLTSGDIKRIARQMKRKFDIKFLIIDYLQLVRGIGENQNVRISDVSRTIKGIAKELNIPVIALSQLSRLRKDEKNRIPMLSDLRDSGTLEQDADIVIFIHRENSPYKKEDENGNEIEEETEKTILYIAKRRDGSTGAGRCLFIKKRMRFENQAIEETV
jgi:replicative DNA helicase